MGYHLHTHYHQERSTPSLRSIVSFAFVLGFVHEEEFVILALAASQSIDPITLILVYAVSVAARIDGRNCDYTEILSTLSVSHDSI